MLKFISVTALSQSNDKNLHCKNCELNNKYRDDSGSFLHVVVVGVNVVELFLTFFLIISHSKLSRKALKLNTTIIITKLVIARAIMTITYR